MFDKMDLEHWQLQDAKNRFSEVFNKALQERFKERILEITIGPDYVWGQVLGTCEKNGVTIPAIEGRIASQDIFHNMTILTRNISDMEPSGIQI